MNVASQTFVVEVANIFAAVSLSDFGAMFLLLAPRSDVVAPGLRSNRKTVCDRNHKLVE